MHAPQSARRPAPPLILILFAALAAVLVPVATARADSPITNFFAGPVAASSACNPSAAVTTTGAATRSDFCIAYRTRTDPPAGDDLSSQVIDTPTGFSGEPDRYPQCTNAQFNYAASTSDVSCPANSQMGQAVADIRVATVLLGTQTLAGVNGRVFNLEHTGNDVARLGIVLDPNFIGVPQPKVKIIVRVTLRPSPDVGLRSIIDNLPKTADTQEVFAQGTNRALAVDAFSLRFWGSKADHPSMPRDYGMLGSDCSTDQRTHIAAVSYDGTPTQADAAPYRLTGCDAVPFTPSAEYSTTEKRPDVTTETSVFVRFADYTGDRTSAAPKKTVVTLPAGLSFSGQIASGANGLPLCTADQFGQSRAAHSSCPAATAVGTVKFTSPLLAQPLTGDAFLGPQPGPGELPDLYIEAQLGTADDAPRVKLVGHLTVDDQNRIVTTLDDLPQVLVSEFLLTFRGGDQSAIVTPPTCGTTKGALSAFSYSAPDTAVSSEQDYTVDQECDAAGGFSAGVAFASANPVAGQHGAFTTTITRPDRSQRIARAQVDLPAGEVATLTAVPECSQADAAAGACPENTRVGSVSSLAGVGPAPYSAGGSVYLVSRPAGAVVGLVLKVPVKFGEVDLGTLNVPARIDIRNGDLGLRFIADVPERFKGIPLNIRSIAVALDRPNFSLNPTNCGVLRTTSSFTGSGGATTTADGSFQVSGCDKLGFAPQLEAAATGSTGQLGHPDVAIRITSPDGTSALRQTYVTLPNGVGVDLSQVPRACDQAVFLAGGCPATSIIGKVKGSLSITTDPLAGSFYLLKAPAGKTLPGLGLAFTGRFAGRVVGATSIDTKTGQINNSFDTLPDLPLTSLQIDVAGGNGSALLSTRALCASTAKFAGRFVAHSGPTVNRTTETSCGTPLGAGLTKVSARLGGMRKGRPTLVFAATAPGKYKIKQIDVTMPSGFSLSKSRSASSKGVGLKSLTVKGKTRTKRISTRRLRATLPTAGTTKVKVLTRSGTMSIRSKTLRKTKKKQVVSVTVTYTDKTKATVPLLLTPH